MNKIVLLLLTTLSIIVIACGSKDKKHSQNTVTKGVDSLMTHIDDLHIVGMSKMAKLTKMQQQIRRMLDSLNSLPAGQKEAIVSYKTNLDSLLKDLEYAEFAMDKWMPEYYKNTDTLSDMPDERTKYLLLEKEKASKITDAILGGISRADSLLKLKP